MTKHFESIRSFADRTRPTIVNGAWDQASGHLDTRRQSPLSPCCIGAKLAIGLDAHVRGNPGQYDYQDGIRAACAQLDCTEQQLIHLIHACGLNPRIYPFSADPWNVARQTVWDRMAHIEALPAFAGLASNAPPAQVLGAVREANHAFWRRHYGIDERELPHASVEAFWTAFEQAVAPACDLEALLDSAAPAAPVDTGRVKALLGELLPRTDEWTRA